MEYQYGIHSEEDHWNLTDYFRRRFRSVYPSFLTAFLCLYLLIAIRRSSLFYLGTRWTLLLSFAGLDGYFSSAFQTYYLVGEWFLGGMILLYLIYPVIRCLLRHRYSTWIYVSALLLVFYLTADFNLLAVSPLANIFSCMISFTAGIFFERFVRRESGKVQGYVLLINALILLAFTVLKGKTDISESVPLHLAGFLLFQCLYQFGTFIRDGKGRWKITAAYTYEFYIVHHVILDKLLRMSAGYGNGKFRGVYIFFYAAVSFVLSGLAAALLHAVAGKITCFFRNAVISS